MRWIRLLSALSVVMVACGGSAAYDANGSANVAGASGHSGDGTTASSGAPSAVGGTAAGGAAASGAGHGADNGMGGESAGGVSEAGTGNAGAAGAAGAGGQVLPDCQGLDCLAGAELVYWPDRQWQGAASNLPSNELREADYEPKMAPAWDVKFSSDARQVVLTPRAGGNAVQGVRDLQHTDRAWFDLMLAIGGRFVVQVGAPQFQAEYTAYGSGVPIVSSTRGALQSP